MALWAGLAMVAMKTAPVSARDRTASSDAFPYELAFTANQFPYEERPTASPSGDSVAYVVVTPPATQPQDDRFLPNGTPTTADGARLYVGSADARSAGMASAVCAGKGNQWSPAWSPDGQRLAFYSDADGLVHAWTYEAGTGACRRISDAVVRASVFSGSEPRWSPDGATLYLPLDPNPPGATPAARHRSQEATAGVAGTDAIVHYGGGEADQPEKRAGRMGATDVLMMRYYNATLAAVSLGDGRTRILVPAESETRPNRLDLSPSGRWVSYISVIHPREEFSTEYATDLQVVPSAGGAPQSIAKGLISSEHSVNYTRADYRWHPTQDRLFYLKEGRLWSVAFSGDGPGAPQPIAEGLGELAPAVLYFTADGNHLLVGIDPKGTGRDRAPQALALVPLSGGAPRRLALPGEADWQFLDLVRANENVLWQPDARRLAVQMRQRSTGAQAVMRIDIASGRRSTLSSGMYRTNGFVAGGDHTRLVGIYEDIATPSNLYRFSTSVTRGQKLTAIDSRLEGRRYGSAAVIQTRTPQHDGSIASVRTTLLLPPGAKRGDRLPGIVMIYSGSDLSTRASYFGGGAGNTVPSQVFTSRGYVVIMANIVLAPEGTPSHPAQQMTDEVLAQVYAVAGAGYVDIDRLAVSGQSYGGYSTAAIVSHTGLFRAAIPVNGTFDLASFYAGMDDAGGSHWIRWAEQGQGRMGETPWANPQRFIDNSPFYRIDRIHTPMLIVAGERDGAVPYQESKKLFVGLRRLDRPVQLAIYPGQGHVIATWSTPSAVDVSRRMVQFLDKHLGVEKHE
ncbi:prolyl oligopeptidase family serine peptidase [Pseudoxanthomonas winnipegensis]|uniref:S9 family peptidase n=1 Tax=Pseudoxanthomonas winnipegensis TaxID=2480810 RepID=UPI00257880B8|nr:prolyl oligopeptidase family serine peptidase [Pseudoxanthomonas winnipegensis]WJI16112.1 prolyl oligopeptidase family serine peptidase [Pseudoxanthomonas winnipegensis]